MRAAGREGVGEGAFLHLQILSLPEGGAGLSPHGVRRLLPVGSRAGIPDSRVRERAVRTRGRAHARAGAFEPGGRAGGEAGREPRSPLTWRPRLTWRRARPRPPAPPTRPPPLAAAGHLRPDPRRATDAPEEPPRPARQGDPLDDPRPRGPRAQRPVCPRRARRPSLPLGERLQTEHQSVGLSVCLPACLHASSSPTGLSCTWGTSGPLFVLAAGVDECVHARRGRILEGGSSMEPDRLNTPSG